MTKIRIPIPLPGRWPPVSHPFEGTGKVCAYCEGPRHVHHEGLPVKVSGGVKR